MAPKAKAVVLGASGFAGAELLRLLARHPGLEVTAAAAGSHVGRAVTDLYPSLSQYASFEFAGVEEALSKDKDVVFSSLPHMHSAKLFSREEEFKVVDIAGDFRLKDPSLYEEWYGEPHPAPEALERWVYGLTELHRDEIKRAGAVAGPGCYPAAAILALAPIVSAGLVDTDTIHIDAASGVSGAGRAGGEGLDFAGANENVRPYNVVGHKHIPEIEQELSKLAGRELKVSFVPHLVPMTRGIAATCIARLDGNLTDDEAEAVYRDFYAGEPFVTVLSGGALPETKRLTGSNRAEVAVRIDRRTSRAIALSAIDNLGKGAAGQALQNANLMLGFEETAGLEGGGLVP